MILTASMMNCTAIAESSSPSTRVNSWITEGRSSRAIWSASRSPTATTTTTATMPTITPMRPGASSYRLVRTITAAIAPRPATNASPKALQLIAPCPRLSRQPTGSIALGWIGDGGQEPGSSLEAGGERRGRHRDSARQEVAGPSHYHLDRAGKDRRLHSVLQRQEGALVSGGADESAGHDSRWPAQGRGSCRV